MKVSGETEILEDEGAGEGVFCGLRANERGTLQVALNGSAAGGALDFE